MRVYKTKTCALMMKNNDLVSNQLADTCDTASKQQISVQTIIVSNADMPHREAEQNKQGKESGKTEKVVSENSRRPSLHDRKMLRRDVCKPH